MQLLENSVNRKRIYCILLIIIFFGVILRIYGISKESLWNDELSSWVMSNYETFSEVVKEGAYPDVHPPGYHILLYFIEKYVGDSEAVLRTPSAIAGSISIVLIFLVGIKLYTFEEGLIASAFMAFSWCPIFYSQEARSNSLLLMFTLLSMYFWITLLDQLNSDKGKCQYSTILGYVLSAIISCYLHYFGLFFIALQGIVAVIFMLKRKRK